MRPDCFCLRVGTTAESNLSFSRRLPIGSCGTPPTETFRMKPRLSSRPMASMSMKLQPSRCALGTRPAACCPAECKTRCTSSMNSLRMCRRSPSSFRKMICLIGTPGFMSKAPTPAPTIPTSAPISGSPGRVSPACNFSTRTVRCNSANNSTSKFTEGGHAPSRSGRSGWISRTTTPVTWIGRCFRTNRGARPSTTSTCATAVSTAGRRKCKMPSSTDWPCVHTSSPVLGSLPTCT